MYAYAQAFEDVGKWILIASRFIMGLGAGEKNFLNNSNEGIYIQKF